MQSAEQISSDQSDQSAVSSQANTLSDALTDDSHRVFQTLSGEGFVLVGYQPPQRPACLQSKQISTGDILT